MLVEKYIKDELIYHGNMKAGWGYAILSGISQIYKDISNWPSNVPVLFLHGTEDSITPIVDTRYIFGELSDSVQKTFIEYPGIRHELFHESKKFVSLFIYL